MPCQRACCGVDPHGIGERFGADDARDDLSAYHERGPGPVTDRLVEVLRTGAVGRTLTDIGGGVGIVSHELLAAGLARAVEVDASKPYLDAALEEARRRGAGDRFHAVEGDFVVVRPLLDPTDIVVLDRTLCCYPDATALASAAAAHAIDLLAMVYPVDAWWTRLLAVMEHAWVRLRGRAGGFWVHRDADVRAAIAAEGLALRTRERHGYWQLVVYGRIAEAPGGIPSTPDHVPRELTRSARNLVPEAGQDSAGHAGERRHGHGHLSLV